MICTINKAAQYLAVYHNVDRKRKKKKERSNMYIASLPTQPKKKEGKKGGY
jgi:hypothetical protein